MQSEHGFGTNGPGTSRPGISKPETDWPGVGWASSCSYRDLYEEASAYEQDIHLQFVTPTLFEDGDSVSPMPSVSAVFHPLRKRWNRYSELVFAPGLIKNIVPLTFDIKTEEISTNVGKTTVGLHRASTMQGANPIAETVTGCIGRMSFRITGNDPLITKRINALADFSSYCGIGYGTPVGMGMLRRLCGSNVTAYQPQIPV